MRTKLRDSVVVITGASSGIGRATALVFARHGSTVVLCARRDSILKEVADEARHAGATEAVAVPTDVTDEDAVKDLARQAIEAMGRIDVWVNNAAVTMFAGFEEAPSEAYRRVLETNLFGYIHGARAVLPYFREQGHGILINNSSVVAATSQPYTGAYVISKHGIRALGMNLRQELLLDGKTGIRVCTIMPATIDTPLFQHGANYTGREVKAMPPVYPAEKVARAIVSCARRPRREKFVGGRAIAMQQKYLPAMTERMMAKMVDKQHLYQDRVAPPRTGNLFDPIADGREVSGDWQGAPRTRARRVGALALAAGAVVWAMNRRSGD